MWRQSSFCYTVTTAVATNIYSYTEWGADRLSNRHAGTHRDLSGNPSNTSRARRNVELGIILRRKSLFDIKITLFGTNSVLQESYTFIAKIPLLTRVRDVTLTRQSS